MLVSFWGDLEKNRFESGGELEVVGPPKNLPQPGDQIPVLFFNAQQRTAPVRSRVTAVDPASGSYRIKREE